MDRKKVISIEDKIPTLKEERKKKANRRLLFYLSIFFILISIIVYLQSPFSHVKEIVINGNNILTEEQVIELSQLNQDVNIWTINQSDLKQRLEDIAVIKTATIVKKYPWTLKITINEHFLIGYLNDKDKYSPILENGNVLMENEFFTLGEAPVLNNFTDEQFLHRFVAELSEVPESIRNLISEVNWTPSEKNKYKIKLYMNDGFVVQATIRDFSNKMKNYPSIVSQLEENSKGIIHMNVGSYFEAIE